MGTESAATPNYQIGSGRHWSIAKTDIVEGPSACWILTLDAWIP